jgi:hypothetical protein
MNTKGKVQKDIKRYKILFLNPLKTRDATHRITCMNKIYQREQFCIINGVHVWAGHVARMGVKRNAYRILVGKPEGKRPLGRPKRRWLKWILER